ncbi:DNA-3-methyladenine glycosylase II [Arcticibacter svalbardensis MN12-7]|uniref:Putative 3-methyladenine DNA glycosylase n=1 Tax=Arcticibacter svalbardensis MN12-7 TaxID=1150600 RepID=R9GVI4_9SPHI|nr:DNA-3-methyladenine glycosylase [Arcticibacter svalbardensis]EOR95862.1 DNA-3-methyladenine glycosylase II [Arcticibacter svalbardensis MN12-7]
MLDQLEHAKLPDGFYLREDVLLIARELLGKKLCTDVDGLFSSGIIVEVEAYMGPEDRGSHAYNNKRTNRNEVMYARGGVVYMYICYGIHDMLNIVTGAEGSSHAILIRALQPADGIPIMQSRRGITDLKKLCKGPGALAKAMGLVKLHNGISLQSDKIWIEENKDVSPENVVETARVGMNFEGIYKSIPWRFYIKGNPYISKK